MSTPGCGAFALRVLSRQPNPIVAYFVLSLGELMLSPMGLELARPNAFLGKTTRPSDSDLEKALGRAKPLWDQLVAELGSEHDVTTREWKSYSAKNGWSLRLKRGKRPIVWLAIVPGALHLW